MKFKIHSIRRLVSAASAALLVSVAPSRAIAQNLYVANYSNSIGEYNAITGSVVSNPFPVSGLNAPVGVALAGNTLYVANKNASTVTAYNATTGSGAAFITLSTGSFTNPVDVLASGGLLYVSTLSGNTVNAYNAATGATALGFTTISGLSNPTALTLLGTTLYVTNQGTNSIRTYNALTGALLNPAFLSISGVTFLTVANATLYVSDYSSSSVQAFDATTGIPELGFTTIAGVGQPQGVKVSGNNLFVANGNRISEYNATTGALINANFITGLNGPDGRAISDVPEPSIRQCSASGSGA